MNLYFRMLCIGIWAAAISSCASPRTGNSAATRQPAGLEVGLFQRLDAILEKEEKEKAIAGGVLIIRRGGETIYEGAFGKTVPSSRAREVTPDTLFDVASLAKPMAGVPCGILLLERENKPSEQAVREVLAHRFVLPDEEYFPKLRTALEALDTPTREAAFNVIFDVLIRDPESGEPIKPGEDTYNYSNTAYMLLGVNALATDEDLEGEIRRRFWEKLGLRDTTFFPHERRTTAASGRDAEDEWIVGRPYDPVADFFVSELKLPAMHSGLFSTAADVALFADALAKPQEDPDLAKLSLMLFSEPTRLEFPGGGHLYISDGGMESPADSPFAPLDAGPGRFYMQTGFTGCMMWVDVDTGTSIALLTNATATDQRDRFTRMSSDVVKAVILSGRP